MVLCTFHLFCQIDSYQVLDVRKIGLEDVVLDPTKFLHQEFMQGIFSKIEDECPEMKGYINYIYTQKKSMTVD